MTRRRTLSLMAVVLALSVAGASQLDLRLDYFELLPKDTPEVLDLAFVSKKSGGQGYLIVELSGDTRDARIAAGRRLNQALSKDADVAHVDFERELDPALIPWLADDDALDRAIAEIDSATRHAVEAAMSLDDDAPASLPTMPFSIPRFIEKDDRLYLIAKPAFVIGSIPRVQAFVARVETIARAAAGPVRFELGGPMIFNLAFVASIQRDLQRISVLAALLVALSLWLTTRSVRASLVLFVPVSVGIAASLCVAWLTIGHLTIISGLLVALLAGLGVESGIHVYLRWREEGSADAPRAARDTMPGSLTGALTNAAAFFVLMGCDLQAFREFGVIAGLGILLTFAATFAFLPALLSFLPAKPRAADAPERGVRITRPAAITVLVLGIVCAAAGARAFTELKLDRNFTSLHGEDNPDQAGLRAAAALGTTLMPTIAWVPSEDDAATLAQIIGSGGPIKSARSRSSLIHPPRPERFARLTTLLKRVPRTPERDAVLRSLSGPPPTTLPEWITRIYTPSDREGALVVIESTAALDDQGDLDAFVAALDAAIARAKERGIDVRVLSENRIAARIFRLIQKDGPFIAWATVLAVSLTLLVLLRRPGSVLLLLLPLTVGACVTALFVRLAHVPLNFINLAIVPSLLTMAIDNVVHLHHRYRHEGKDRLPQIAFHSGGAVLSASAVNFSGYAAALVAKFAGLFSLGALASIGVGSMIFATVPWFVALLFLRRR